MNTTERLEKIITDPHSSPLEIELAKRELAGNCPRVMTGTAPATDSVSRTLELMTGTAPIPPGEDQQLERLLNEKRSIRDRVSEPWSSPPPSFAYLVELPTCGASTSAPYHVALAELIALHGRTKSAVVRAACEYTIKEYSLLGDCVYLAKIAQDRGCDVPAVVKTAKSYLDSLRGA